MRAPAKPETDGLTMSKLYHFYWHPGLSVAHIVSEVYGRDLDIECRRKPLKSYNSGQWWHREMPTSPFRSAFKIGTNPRYGHDIVVGICRKCLAAVQRREQAANKEQREC